ncbi:MAG: hypothetical protein IKS78_00280, partial [Clostridia bacterium]|nr:hypothetical protein [Clostridia bacterium]
ADNNDIASKLHVDGAGSVSVNLLDGETAAIVDHTAVKSKDVKLTAGDSLFDGAWAGGASVNWQGSKNGTAGGGTQTNVAVGGAVAVNSSARGVSSVLRAATVEDADSVTSLAEKSGTDVAVALGVAVTNSGENSGLDLPIGASVSYNSADTNAYSLLIDNTVTGTGETTVTSEASLSDLQVAGGAGAGMSFGNGNPKSGAIGGTAAVSRIENDIESGILGGTYTNVGDIDLAATKSANQVDAAVAGAISTEGRSVGFAGAVAYSETDNTGRALLSGANVSSSGNIRVESREAANANEYREYLQSLGVDPDGTAYMGENGSGQLGELSGSTIVNVAVAGEHAGKGGAAAGVYVGSVENDIAAEVDSSITAKSLTAQTENKAEIIAVTLGASMGGETFGGAAGVGWIDMKNDSRVTFGANSNITADSIQGNAVNDADIVNVGGEAGISGKGAVLGLNLVYNSMDNTTGAYAEGGTYNAPVVSLAAENNADIFGLSLGVSYSSEKGAFNGVIALASGDNNTEAVFGSEEATATVTGVRDFSVTA